MKALNPIRTLLIWLIVSSLLAAAAAWLAWSIGCLYSTQTPLCRHDYGGVMVALAGVLLVVGPVAWNARQRALRAVGRGMYARPVGGGHGASRLVENVMYFIVEGELDQRHVGNERRGLHPLDVEAGHGWRVPLSDGSGVVVYFEDFREWLYDCWEFQDNPANCRKGATSQRRNDPLIGRPQTLARNHLLDVGGGLRRNKAVANTKRRIEGTPWGILERLAAEWPPGEV